MEQSELKYLKTLSRQYPTVAAAATEIINLRAIMHLPKGTEHFITDLHGEYDQFRHVLRNGSGAIKRKIEEEFGPAFRSEEKKELATLIYYPEQKLTQIKRTEADIDEWYQTTIHRLVRVCRHAACKYTRSKVRKAIPREFAYIIDELIRGRLDEVDQEAYYNEIINSVIETKRSAELIIAFCDLIRRLVVDHLHVVGDIFDRGPYPHIIMDTLMQHHSVDIQWGNHDVLWMGAAAGNTACIACTIRIAAKYGNLGTLEDGYGINLVPLAKFAMEVYGRDDCSCFQLDVNDTDYHTDDTTLDEKIHKAIAIIQLKIEGQIIKNNPQFDMDDRLLLDKMDLEKGTVLWNGREYALKDTYFPTIDPKDPYALSPEEEEVVERLKTAFVHCDKLQRHIRFLYSQGSMYKVHNGNLLYHGCVPLNPDGSFAEVELYGSRFSGKALYDELEAYARKGYFAVDATEKQRGLDMLWYIWQNKNSPVFGKERMTTFERYFISDKETHTEPKNPYYSLLENEEVVDMILKEFGLGGKDSHIINGHVPVEAKKGESPIKCGGRLLIIDGGFSKAYQTKTGIAGYTLIYNSYGLMLAAHEPFESVEKAVQNGSDIHSESIPVQYMGHRKMVADTDTGAELMERVQDLTRLLDAYRSGIIKENRD